MTDAREKGMAILSYPKSLKIGAFDWKIEAVADLREKESGTRLYGQCDPEHLTIRVNADIEREQIKAETIFHELLHAIWNHFHMDEKEDEETSVSCLSTGITMVMRDNPSLKRYFWEVWK